MVYNCQTEVSMSWLELDLKKFSTQSAYLFACRVGLQFFSHLIRLNSTHNFVLGFSSTHTMF